MMTPPTLPCRAPLLIGQMKTASGGAAWRRVAELSAVGAAADSGLRGSAVVATDLRDGRYALRFSIVGMGSYAEIYDGATLWKRDISGGVHALDAPFARERAATDAYLARRGYFSGRESATLACLSPANEDGRRVERVRVVPAGGIPADLSIDAKTHLLGSVSERMPTTTAVTRYADYRQVGPLALPFSISSGTQSQPANSYAVAVRSYRLRKRPQAADFAEPRDLHPPLMRDGAATTTVPLKLDGRQLLVWASIDGHAPMPFILDTGGHAILTTQAAKALRLRAAGAGESGGSGAGTIGLQYARVASVSIGRAELVHQTFLVIPYPYSFYERGRHQPLAGILGLEFFERFAARIDYGRLRLTLTPFARYGHHATKALLPICFQDDMPLGTATADGHRGLFGIDTGNAGTVILFGTFLQKTGLERKYSGGVNAVGHGTGGSNAGRIVSLRRLAVARRVFTRVPTFLTSMTSGSFSSWTEAGNFGYEILSRFLPTFDYARGVLYLDSSPYATGPPVNRAGLVAGKDDPSRFVVLRVAPGSPAALAAIAAGDSILGIDGRPAVDYSYGDFYALVTGRAGSVMRLLILHDGKKRDVALRLKG